LGATFADRPSTFGSIHPLVIDRELPDVFVVGKHLTRLENAPPLTGDLPFLLLDYKVSSTDGLVDEMIRCQLYELRNTELFQSDKYITNNIYVAGRCFMCWVAYRHQFLLVHKPPVSLCPL
jgi:hypothetical protein